MTAGTRVGDTMRNLSQEIEAEATRLIAFLNDKVVPEVRQSSSVALRIASEQLGRMAEHLEHGSRPRSDGENSAHGRAIP